jgi:hypothetical protein
MEKERENEPTALGIRGAVGAGVQEGKMGGLAGRDFSKGSAEFVLASETLEMEPSR